MNDHDFLDELTQQWQRDTAALDVSRRSALRQLWTNRLALAGEFALSGVSLYVVWYFWQQEAMLYTVSALVVLLAVVASMWISLRERVPLWHWHDWSPEGVLRYRIRLCESTLRFAALCRASGVVLLLFAAYLWVSAFVEPASVPAFFPGYYTAVALFTCVCLEWWARRQRKLRTGELAELRDLLQSFEARE